jgi:hypothetical protein
MDGVLISMEPEGSYAISLGRRGIKIPKALFVYVGLRPELFIANQSLYKLEKQSS